ncbi:MAG: hypothetical protein Q8R13_05785 [bacterium]|nr:hypothetical protein [bacterium]MDZ4284352.1 hypothetical protein [Patescibacteria group bacterium]
MKERTVSRRNFVGAFWGGVLGILAFGYLHPVALPFGCFFGAVVGWWYQEIWQSVADSFRRGVVRTQHAWNRFTTFVLTPTHKLKEVRFDIGPYLKVLHFFVFAFVWILRRPIAFVRLLWSHPMNRALMVRSLAATGFVGLTALWAIPFATWCFTTAGAVPKDSPLILLLVLSGIFVPLVAAIYPIALDLAVEDTSSWRGFYRNWERYASRGAMYFFARDLVNFFRCQISIALFLGGAAIWFTGIGGAFVFLVVAPISAMVGAVKGFYEFSTKAGHWLCFGTTVVVTAFIAWIAHPYLNDARALWIVALLAGLASAGATECLRRSLVWFFSFSERARAIASATLGAQLAPSGRAFWRITKQVGDKFNNALPVPI